MSSGQQARAQAAAITPSGQAVDHERAPADRVRALFDGHPLSPGQRRIAQYLVDHLTEAAFLSITELAERAA